MVFRNGFFSNFVYKRFVNMVLEFVIGKLCFFSQRCIPGFSVIH